MVAIQKINCLSFNEPCSRYNCSNNRKVFIEHRVTRYNSDNDAAAANNDTQ